jgi:Ca-activated chloride channel family protein
MRALICMAWMLLVSLPLPLDNPPTVSVPTAGTGPESSLSRTAHQQQDASKSGFTIRSSAELVTVDAIVRTSGGGFAGDLQAGDFVVYDNGVAQDITLFSRERLPLAVALVVDRSPSVQPYLAQLRKAALTALDRLQPEDQVTLFSFDMDVAQLSELTQDRQTIARLVSLIPSGSGTNIYDALFDASSYLRSKAPGRRRAILLVSDNSQSVDSAHSDRDTLQELLEASTMLYCIETRGDNPGGGGFGGPGRIARIAKETGGEVLKAGTLNSLVEALDSALLNLKAGYVLGFAPSNIGEEGGYHRLLVGLNVGERCPKCQVQARTGYYAGARVGAGSNAGVPVPPWAAGASPAFPVKPSGVSAFNRPAEMEEAISQYAIATAHNQGRELRDIAFEVSVAAEQDAGGKPQARIDLRIDAANVMFRFAGGRYVGRLRITAFYMDSKGRSLGADWKIMDMRLTEPTYQQMLQSGIPYATTIPLQNPDQRIRVVVYDPGSARLGSQLVQMK